MHGKSETGAEIFREFRYFHRLRTSGAAHVQWVAEDDFADIIFRHDLCKFSQVAAFVLAIQRVQALGGDTESVGYREADPAGTKIQGENAFAELVRNRFRAHTAIIAPTHLT